MKRWIPFRQVPSRFAATAAVVATLAMAIGAIASGAGQDPQEVPRPTERQRAHSRAYAALLRQGVHAGTPGGRSILEVPFDRTITDETFSLVSGASPRSEAEALSLATCESDLVVVGRPVGSSAYLSEDAYFILTDYQLEIEQVLRGAGVQSGDTVTYVRPGGRLMVRGRTVRATHSAYPHLTLDRRYILFMDQVEETSAYKIVSGSSRILDALVVDTQVKGLGPQAGGELRKSAAGLALTRVITLIRGSVCAGGGGL